MTCLKNDPTKNKTIQSEWKTKWGWKKTSGSFKDIPIKAKYLCIVFPCKVNLRFNGRPVTNWLEGYQDPCCFEKLPIAMELFLGKEGRWCFMVRKPSRVELQKLFKRITSILSLLSHVEPKVLRTTNSNCGTLRKKLSQNLSHVE